MDKIDNQFINILPDSEDSVLFARYAGIDIQKWNAIVGMEVIHKVFGYGKIIGFYQINGSLTANIEFSNLPGISREKRIDLSAFERGFFEFPNEIGSFPMWENVKKILIAQREEERKKLLEEEQEMIKDKLERAAREVERLAKVEELRKQKKKEAEDQKRFNELLEKYLVDGGEDFLLTSPLFPILLKLEESEGLSAKEINWLEQHKLFAPLAFFYENEIRTEDADVWTIVKAGAIWRKAGNPEKALSITNGVNSNLPRANAALLTNRGGAYRDLSQLNDAKNCALKALEYDTSSYYAYNLLGAVYLELGELAESDRCFETAIELGSPQQIVDNSIREFILKTKMEEQKNVAFYLLKKDPIRFKWAEAYL